MPETLALIVAAGRGHRLGGDLPKQYRDLGGQPLLRHSVRRFLDHPAVDGVRVAIHPDDRALYDAAVQGLDLPAPVPGGATRQDSCRLALESAASAPPRFVLIHDAARPFPPAAAIDDALAALDAHDGAVVAVPVVDTLKRETGGLVAETVDRAGLWRAQTPQAFRYDAILEAHRAAIGDNLTDDAAVAERAGLGLVFVTGSEDNFKVTTEDDLRRAGRLAGAAARICTGSGFDVHRLGDGDHVWLGGVRIPHDRGLIGHSDADVALHALTDAILGAIAAGDIGSHFPPSDPQWKGASSDIFLGHAGLLVHERGGSIDSLDLTVICEAPRLGPHRDAMVARIAGILDLPADRVSVKATTTERLGFTGRGEGIAAQAVATVRLPG